MFEKMDSETHIMEDGFRHFVEECDLLQGIQTTMDISSFGSFASTLLERIRDDHAKTPILTFPCMSALHIPQGPQENDNRQLALQVIGDALALNSLTSSLSTLTVPIQPTVTWPVKGTSPSLSIDPAYMYHTSALLSTHVETSTFPLRAKQQSINLSSLCGQLNWRGDTPVAHLSGTFPLLETQQHGGDIVDYDFSSRVDIQHGQKLLSKSLTYFGQQAVLRSNATEASKMLVWDRVAASAKGLRQPLLSNLPYPEYPIPTSYPKVFNSASGVRASKSPSVRAASALSLLSTSSKTSRDILGLASFVTQYSKRGRFDSEAWEGIDRDLLKDLAEDLTNLGESWGGGGYEDESEDDGHVSE